MSAPSTEIAVVTECQPGRGTLTSFWFAAPILREQNVKLSFCFTYKIKDTRRILFCRRIVFDGAAALRTGFGPGWYLLGIILRKQLAVYWHETEWGIDAARQVPQRLSAWKWVKTYLVRQALRNRSVHHFQVCQHGCNILVDRYGVSKDSVSLLNNCSNSERALAHPYESAPKPGLFVAVGRLQPRKGVDLFLDIAQKVAAERPESRFVWIGAFTDAPYSEEHLKARVQERQLDQNVTFAGFMDDPLTVMSEAEAVLLTSRDDPFPKVLQEALAVGRSCVAFDVGGAREILDDLGETVPVGDVDAFARCLTDPSRRAQDGATQRRRRERYQALYSKDAFATRFLEVLGSWDRQAQRGQDSEDAADRSETTVPKG
ncbi:glycosyltransferase family 4 protein [Rhodovibrio salinarum]|uniref:Uncharacterized protein n=1 Tax=Rhodovibrio salinarum TaxID=1087 RepID=A0A934UZG2_9PROT|nr:glycosyltransferase [Rhodovibrio salinarum]MBK1696374.1 hypothetical protein [Rhodovibrio salinarum]